MEEAWASIKTWTGRALWRISPWHRYRVHPARMNAVFATTPRKGETGEQMIARHLAQARPFEVAWLFKLRTTEDGKDQRDVYQAYLAARATYWTRFAALMAAISLPVSIVAIIVSLA